MSYVSPPDVVEAVLDAGDSKSRMGAGQLMLRAGVAVFLLGAATMLATTVTVETGYGFVGALVFPLGLTIVLLLGMELVTGAFALIPPAILDGRTTTGLMLRNFGWALVGHVIGGLLAGVLAAAVISRLWSDESTAVARELIDTAVGQTLDYQELGVVGGPALALLSGILCNFLVALGVVLAQTSSSTGGKILAIWPPIVAFYAMELEHSVVNLFVLPTSMMLGAPIGVGDWWLWNQIPVLIGNLIGGALLVGLPLYWAHRRKS
ncbi:MAG: formate/nitrite transporter family protein [Nesterenkonia sp.]|nr:formate/nitrite transporter family protein [Nesterenkonia sp.]